ncbi:MAG: hypothetical protein AABM67_02805 [Acidobacteriota bacterium]
MKIKRLALFSVAFICSLTVLPNLGIQLQISAQKNDAPKYVSLLKRVQVGNNDNYTRAAFSFKFGLNGDAAVQVTRNNWDLLFGNSPTPDAFDVTMVGDDRSRIKDLGQLKWTDKLEIPVLPAYERPTREPSVKAIVGDMYLVHTKDSKQDHYALFRVESLVPGKEVTISWKLIPSPESKE